MTTGTIEIAPPARAAALPPLVRVGGKVLLLAGAALVLGGLTSFAQGVLPDVLRPLANSASGWTIPTAILVWALRERAAVSALLGVIAFECLVLGYVLVSHLRGIPDDETAFLVIGLLGGPIVGAASSWLHERGWRAAAGAGVLAGVLLGDASWGLGVVAGTTGWIYWVVVGVLGLALLAVVGVLSRFGRREALLAVGTALATAAAFLAVYTVLS